jgi:hypothetical protein
MILEIAALSARTGDAVPLDTLRPLYPELAFLFDYVEDVAADRDTDVAEAEKTAREEVEALQGEIDALEARALKLRNAALQLAYLAVLMPGMSHAEAQDTLSHVNTIVKEDLQ